ncbi:hypothetical protein K504DRAFT_473908 [Pleomassaria siparia CBS 279.74]|uniref:F-box domain-containing protein n=1 Tax=Pleomassaria siparia CBS 279.74 TaxID=1314801 RepID=A0A6G1JU32_9PLEO|nr:hypothetical protein K504DRAFT_473908 [Pleomassaria siparia CBS 279.74]
MEQSTSLTNVSSYLPSPADLLLAVPRLLYKAGSLGGHIDSVFGKLRSGGSVIAEPTASNLTNATMATTASNFVQESVATAAAAATTALGMQDDTSTFQALKNVGSFFSYITSKWAIATFAMGILQAIRCQTSPSWSEMQYGIPNMGLDTDFAGEGGMLWRGSSALLAWQTVEDSCRAVNMLPVDAAATRPAGSLALLWPLFVSLGFGHFVETLSCALQGRQPIQEVGMTLFEHSLAFAEAEAVVTRPLNMDSTRFWKPTTVLTPDGTSLSINRSVQSQFANVPPEVLLISLISSFSHLTSNFLAIVGLRTRFRLITTSIWGLSYMAAFAWSFVRFATMASALDPGHQIGILRFPTVCIIGFIPHLLILVGMVACGVIYLLAFGLTVLSPPPGQPDTLTWRERMAVAYGNLHANIHLSSITPLAVNWHEDFYTAILKVGFTVLTAASEAVYLNEGARINVNSMTWVEKKRLKEVLARRRRFQQSLVTIPSELRGDTMAEGIEVTDAVNAHGSSQLSVSGYARERKTREAHANRDAARALGRESGVGLQQRRGRWSLTCQFLRGISRLLMAIQARVAMTMLRKLRITYRPRWLYRLAGPQANEKTGDPASASVGARFRASEPWLVVDEQTRIRPDATFDVEAFARERLRKSGLYEEQGPQPSEEHLNEYLYEWWRKGGKWGDVDMSPDYDPGQDDDATSVTSFATTNDEDGWSDVDEGQRTPTQSMQFMRTRESTTPQPENVLDLSHLSHLLDPKTKEDREEAQLLSRHLQTPGVLTRSQYREVVERDESKILGTSRYRLDGFAEGIHMTPEEEETLLEDFILSRRHASAAPQADSSDSWGNGADGMGSEGPQCVVCQTSPRTVLVWPCSCLSLCDECRNHNLIIEFLSEPRPFRKFNHQQPTLSSPAAHYHRLSSPDRLGLLDSDEAARLSPTSLSPSPRNRITDYENAVAQSARKKSEGCVFEVIKKNRTPDDHSSPISKLPNEILTHALSHLSPNDLAAVSLVARRFNDLVTTPHAWRVAFARYFPGPEALIDNSVRYALEDAGNIVRSERRSFTRLTAFASWRSEYILRTRLLRSLTRGKPVQIPSSGHSTRHGQTQAPTPVIMYNAQTFTIINHLHATFGVGLNKRSPRFVHGADDIGMATSSDPGTGKVDAWGQNDPNFYEQFSERFPGVAEWGLGSGEIIGCPNVMDVSQPHGMVYGQGCPEGSCYYRALDEMRGHFVGEATDFSLPEAGIPKLGVDGGAICSVWIAKTPTIPALSDGLVGIMIGSAAGIVTACSLGTDGLRGPRLQRGELTARWVLSPGVPIVALTVDEQYSLKRQAQNRVWAVALNALGELFHLTKFPTRSRAAKPKVENHAEYVAWLAGRSVYWNLVEPSRRVARPDPYHDGEMDGSYSPRTSWDGMCLSTEQVVAETLEIRQYMKKKPKDFRKACLGWDMRRRLEVDFAGDDGNYAGEAMVVFECGLEEGSAPEIKRYTRMKTPEKERGDIASPPTVAASATSLFGGGPGTGTPEPPYGKAFQRTRSSSYLSSTSSPERTNLVEEWRCSTLSFGGLRALQVTTTALDQSTFAVLTMSEDSALGFSTASSSPYGSPISVASQPVSPLDLPGQRARFVAVGTKTGLVMLWDIRSPVSRSSNFVNTLDPVRIIYTESPEISCIALTALHLVHGGNDGLVQAWDPLASSSQPVRTLNSRFSSRARRTLVQAQASAQGVGINMFAAGAICLDPDPTVLRGAVSLGTQIRYWSYSSSAADQYKSSKRKLRRSERGSNSGGEKLLGSGRVNLKDYIANEKYELERDKEERRRQADRLAGRFGVDLLNNEDEALAYAAMLSQESLKDEEKRRRESESSSTLTSNTVTPEPSVYEKSTTPTNKDDLDADLAEAIRLSLQDSPASGLYGSGSPAPSASGFDTPFEVPFDIPIKYAKGKKSKSSNGPTISPRGKNGNAGSSKDGEMDDLEFALQLSLAEEQSRKEAEANDFPLLSPSPRGGGSWKGKGKGKGKMS